MNFVDQIVIPPSDNHVMLLKAILTISLFLFIPYVGMMLGASSVSIYFNRAGKKSGNEFYIRFAKDVIERLTITKNAELALGSIPVVSIVFAYAQLLYEAKTITTAVLSLSALLFIIAFVFIYRYRNSFQIEGIIKTFKRLVDFNSVKGDESLKEIKEYEEKLKGSSSRSGKIGTLLLFIASYFFIGSTSLAADPNRWAGVNNILEILFSWVTAVNFLYLLASSGSITGGAILFYFFKWQGGLKNMDEDYSKFVKNFSVGLAFFSTLCLPVLLFLNFIYLPQVALSQAVFLYMILALVVMLVLCNFLYSMVKNSDIRFATVVFLLIFFVFVFSIIKDQLVFGNAIKEQTAFVILKSEQLDKEIKSKSITGTGLTGEQIYNQKCVACHKFDQRLVGPPHNLVVPKYNGDIQKLAAFIYNPQKIDPAYPPMPNQGLKKKEALVVAQYLISRVSGKK